jgi:hypothetical protein
MFDSILNFDSLSLFSQDGISWIKNNETGYSISVTANFPKDWNQAINRAAFNKENVRFCEEMTGTEMAAYLSSVYEKYCDTAHYAKMKPADNSRFLSQDETKEDWA